MDGATALECFMGADYLHTIVIGFFDPATFSPACMCSIIRRPL
jgi:hypothetical protein